MSVKQTWIGLTQIIYKDLIWRCYWSVYYFQCWLQLFEDSSLIFCPLVCHIGLTWDSRYRLISNRSDGRNCPWLLSILLWYAHWMKSEDYCALLAQFLLIHSDSYPFNQKSLIKLYIISKLTAVQHGSCVCGTARVGLLPLHPVATSSLLI